MCFFPQDGWKCFAEQWKKLEGIGPCPFHKPIPTCRMMFCDCSQLFLFIVKLPTLAHPQSIARANALWLWRIGNAVPQWDGKVRFKIPISCCLQIWGPAAKPSATMSAVKKTISSSTSVQQSSSSQTYTMKTTSTSTSVKTASTSHKVRVFFTLNQLETTVMAILVAHNVKQEAFSCGQEGHAANSFLRLTDQSKIFVLENTWRQVFPSLLWAKLKLLAARSKYFPS